MKGLLPRFKTSSGFPPPVSWRPTLSPGSRGSVDLLQMVSWSRFRVLRTSSRSTMTLYSILDPVSSVPWIIVTPSYVVLLHPRFVKLQRSLRRWMTYRTRLLPSPRFSAWWSVLQVERYLASGRWLSLPMRSMSSVRSHGPVHSVVCLVDRVKDWS